jgi:N-acetylglucosaminyl-diphospho-decaprenol L-rhamnosyltransferase
VPDRVEVAVVIPTLNARELLRDALASLARQTLPASVVVVDNGSSDGTVELVASSFPTVSLLPIGANLGFGQAVNRGALELEADILVLVNNDVVCQPDFIEQICEPFAAEDVGMVAGVLLQQRAPERIDSAGIELDGTLRSWDYLWNLPVDVLSGKLADPVGPCGGAAAYRLPVFRELGGFDERLFAYWEDIDLALRLRAAGWRCVLAPGARALHRHGATLGAASPAQRRLEAFGRGYVLAKYRVCRRRPLARLQVALLDWPALLVHLVARRELAPLAARVRGLLAGRSSSQGRAAPLDLATVGFREALARQGGFLRLRFAGGLPEHFHESAGSASRLGVRS